MYIYYTLKNYVANCSRCDRTTSESNPMFILPWGNACTKCCTERGIVIQEGDRKIVVVEDYRTFSWTPSPQ